MNKEQRILVLMGIGAMIAGFILAGIQEAKAYPGPCPIGQSQCMVIPGYNAPQNRWQGTPGLWENGHYTPITENPYGRR